MENFIGVDSHIHNIARGVLMQGDKIILCHLKDADWYFLPGGHIEDGESATQALARELNEEIKEIDFEITSFIGVCESVFSEADGRQHEINLVFSVAVEAGVEIESALDHIAFKAVDREDFTSADVLPNALHEGVLGWLDTGECFFKEIR